MVQANAERLIFSSGRDFYVLEKMPEVVLRGRVFSVSDCF